MQIEVAFFQQVVASGVEQAQQQDAMAIQTDSHLQIWQKAHGALEHQTYLNLAAAWLSVADGVSCSPDAALASYSFLQVLHQQDLAQCRLEQATRTAERLWQSRYANKVQAEASATLASIAIRGDAVQVVNCGDSRIWRIRTTGAASPLQ